MTLNFGIPSLDELLNLSSEAPAKKTKPDLLVESYAIVGADGSGKSVLGLHMASRYHADCWAINGAPGKPRTPRVVYVSSDLRYRRALRVWKNFRLDKPNTRQIPFERIPDSMKRYWIEKNLTYPRLRLAELLPSTDSPMGSNSLIEYLLPESPATEAPRIGFLDLATNTAGDDWSFVNTLLAKLESIPTAHDENGNPLPHLVVVDSVLGFETFVGRLDAYGVEQSRRARIAQCMRNAGSHCHLLFVVEEPNEKEHLPEEYVTDVVLRLRQRKRGDAITRTLEIEKARARNHAGGEHPFEIRSKQGSSTRGWENADTPVTQNDYVHVLHSIAHRSALVSRYRGVDIAEKLVASFGLGYLEDLLVGSCNTLLGDPSTGKSVLAEQFLAVGFYESISHFIKVFALFDNRGRPEVKSELEISWNWVLRHLAASVLTASGDFTQSADTRAAAVQEAMATGDRESVAVLKEKEYRDKDSNHWINDWVHPRQRRRLRLYLERRYQKPETRTRLIFATGPEKFDPDPANAANAVLELFNHPNLRWPAVLLTTSNKRSRDLAIDCLAYYQARIRDLIEHCFPASCHIDVWKSLEESLIRFLEQQIIVRRFDVADQTAPVVLHAIVRNLLEAKKLIFGPFFPTSQENHKKKADRIRLVLDDLRVLCDTSPDILKDSAFLPFLTFQLERSGITSLLVYSDAVRPDKRPEDATSRALLSLSKRSFLVWRVPFEGRTRFALTAIPPDSEHSKKGIRELKLVQVRGWNLGGGVSPRMEAIQLPTVTPTFDLYSGVEKGEPVPVPLAVYLYAETKPFAAYAEEENALFRELFTPVEPGTAVAPGRVIFPLEWSRYLAMRDYTHLSLDKLDNHTMIFQVDGSWAVSGEGTLQEQEEYLEREFSSDVDERSVQDPFHLFEGDPRREPNETPGAKPSRREYFRNSHYKFVCDRKDRKDRVPFMWDFGFVLARSSPWHAAFDELLPARMNSGKGQGTASLKQIDLAKRIIPFLDVPEDNCVKSVFDYLSEPHKNPAIRDAGGLSWRKFFGACRLVADNHSSQTGAPALPFDVAASTPETLNAFLLEIWFSEMILEANLRAAAHGEPAPPPASKEYCSRSLEALLRDGVADDQTIYSAFDSFRNQYREFALGQYRRIRQESGQEPNESHEHEATEVEKMKMFERRNDKPEAVQETNRLFSALPLGPFCLYKTWLLLLEVLDFEDYFDRQSPFNFRLGRTASMQAVASRHWYKTACSFATQLYETEGIHDAMAPFRLPGAFSTRGDWFLGSPRSSRSRLLARHAFDLLCSRRANLSRMQHGLGLPVRDIVLDDQQCANLQTALRCRVEELEVTDPERTKKVVRSKQITYSQLARLGHSDEDVRGGFRWLWRPKIEDYDRQSRTLQKWITRMFAWTLELKESLDRDWQGGFIAYDLLTCRRFADVYNYPSFRKLAEQCDLLVSELRASSRKPH